MRHLYYGEHPIIKRYVGDQLVFEQPLMPKDLTRLRIVSTDYRLVRSTVDLERFHFTFRSSEDLLSQRQYISHLQMLDRSLSGPFCLKSLGEDHWQIDVHSNNQYHKMAESIEHICRNFPGTDQQQVDDEEIYEFSEMVSLQIYL